MHDRPSAKGALRRELLARRDGLAPEFRANASRLVAGRILAGFGVAPAILGAYLPIRSEVDPRSLMTVLAERGARVCAPAIKGDHLEFREWTPAAVLEPQGLGTRAPGPAAPVLRPEILLVPLAGFDRRGHRLGYGRGFYDRAIARLRADGAPLLAIGLAFSAQEVPAVPDDPFDIALDAIVTEAEWVRPRETPPPS
nr:5-formyltetrahydrofolate cyclo-ligase [Aureimonas populi]